MIYILILAILAFGTLCCLTTYKFVCNDEYETFKQERKARLQVAQRYALDKEAEREAIVKRALADYDKRATV